MNRFLALSALAVVASPGLALAQSAPSQSVTVNGNVPQACVLGSPSSATLDLGVLTDGAGRLRSDLANAGVSASTTINSAWCNTPSTLTMTSSPLKLITTPSYATPTAFSRELTYTVNLTNWASAVTARPTIANTQTTVTSTQPHAAMPMDVQFSALAPLSGASEVPTNFLEAGAYSAIVSITLAAGS